jgi:hypothetical protein
MNSMLATEAIVSGEEKRTALPPLETWPANERMRHIPAAEWMVQKLDTGLRKRIEKLLAVYTNLPAADPHHATIETEFNALVRAIDRLADAARHARHNGNGSHDVRSRVETALAHAVSSLHSLEQTAFGRRNPYHFFDKSKAEAVYAALLAVICHVERIVPLVRAVDGSIDERLLEGLVVLQNPVDDRMLKPIA